MTTTRTPPSQDRQRGRRLKAARAQTDLRQEDVARQVDVSRATVIRWEDGSCCPQRSKRTKYAEALGLAVQELNGLLVASETLGDAHLTDGRNLTSQTASDPSHTDGSTDDVMRSVTGEPFLGPRQRELVDTMIKL